MQKIDNENDCSSCTNVTHLNGTCICPQTSNYNFDPLEKN